MGVNVEANFAFGSQWIWQTGFTYQQSRFSEQQTIWENEDPTDPKKVSSDRVMRSPELYWLYYSILYPYSSAETQL